MEHVSAVAILGQVQAPLGSSTADCGAESGVAAAAVAAGSQDGVAVEPVAGLGGDKIFAHYRQPAGQIGGAGGADHHAAVSRVGEDLAVVLIELLGLLSPLPLKRVAAVHVIHDVSAFVEAVEGGWIQTGAFQLGLPVVIAHGQDVRPIQIAIGEVSRLAGGAAAQMGLGDGHQLLGTQDLCIVDNLLQSNLLGSAELAVEHALLVGSQPNHIVQSPLVVGL